MRTSATLALATGVLLSSCHSTSSELDRPSAASTVVSAQPPPFLTPSPPTEPTPDEMAAFARSSNAFAFDVDKIQANQSVNPVFAPASLSIVLTIACAGASGGTADELRRVLHVEATPADALDNAGKLVTWLEGTSHGATFHAASRLFGDKTTRIKQPFLDLTARTVRSELERVDFFGAPGEARARMNAWVAENTRGRVADLLPPSAIDESTTLALVNAIYFTGEWKTPFRRARDAPFRGRAASTLDVPTMSALGTYLYAAGGGVRAVALPYQGGTISMLLVLPESETSTAINDLEGSMSPDRLDAIVGMLKPTVTLVTLPKVALQPRSVSFKWTLGNLGVRRAFGDDADFSAIQDEADPTRRLRLRDVFQSAFVTMDEQGTEAGAASAVTARMGGDPARFDAGRPFLFFLREDTSGLILFMGRVSDPTWDRRPHPEYAGAAL